MSNFLSHHSLGCLQLCLRLCSRNIDAKFNSSDRSAQRYPVHNMFRCKSKSSSSTSSSSVAPEHANNILVLHFTSLIVSSHVRDNTALKPRGVAKFVLFSANLALVE